MFNDAKSELAYSLGIMKSNPVNHVPWEVTVARNSIRATSKTQQTPVNSVDDERGQETFRSWEGGTRATVIQKYAKRDRNQNLS